MSQRELEEFNARMQSAKEAFRHANKSLLAACRRLNDAVAEFNTAFAKECEKNPRIMRLVK